MKPLSESLDTVGVFARSVREAALLAGVIARRPGLCTVDPAGVAPRVGLWRTYEWREASRETVGAMDDAARLLAAAGAEVRAAVMPDAFSGLNDAHRVIQYFEMAQALGFEMQRHRERLSPRLRERLEKAEHVTAAEYEAARLAAQRCRAFLRETFNGCDVLLTPAAAGEAPQGLESTGNAVFNRGWTLLGLPCIALPGLRGPQGLPVGVQVVGPYRQDARLLSIATWIERVLPK